MSRIETRGHPHDMVCAAPVFIWRMLVQCNIGRGTDNAATNVQCSAGLSAFCGGDVLEFCGHLESFWRTMPRTSAGSDHTRPAFAPNMGSGIGGTQTRSIDQTST